MTPTPGSTVAQAPTASSTVDTPAERIGTTVDRAYLVEGILGDGAMGIVYRGRALRDGTPVAIKMLRRRGAQRDVIIQRFAREAQILRDLSLPGVVRHIASGLDGQAQYLVTELLRGRTLRQMLAERGAFKVPDAVFCACQLLTTLAAVHGTGILHRDIKPANVFVTDSGGVYVAKLLDFGLGLSMDGDMTALTMPGLRIGTPHYMAPSLIETGKATPASDAYAVAMLLYELLTGELPIDYERDDATSVMGAVMAERRRSLRVLRPDIGPQLRDIIDYAVSRRGGFESPIALLEALDSTQGYAFRRSAIAGYLNGKRPTASA